MTELRGHVPFSPQSWESFVGEYSAEIIANADPFYAVRTEDGGIDLVEPFTAEQRKEQWLGRPPASEQALAEAQERLGASLPPSLRNFLQVSDGWEWPPGDSVSVLWPAAELPWFRDIENAQEVRDEFPSLVGLLDRVLLVGAGVGVAWLLDPTDVDDAGEWAAYRWESEYDLAPKRFDSFAHLFADERGALEVDFDEDDAEDEEFDEDEEFGDDGEDEEFGDDGEEDDPFTDAGVPAAGTVASVEASG